MSRYLSGLLEQIGIDLYRSPLFDRRWYNRTYADLKDDAGPEHFLSQGLSDGRSPNAYIDPAWYNQTYPDVCKARANPVVHYLEHGWREGRDPGPWFSTDGYLDAYPDVCKAKINPLLHFLSEGQRCGRQPTGNRREHCGSAILLVRKQDRESILANAWLEELRVRGFRPKVLFFGVLDRLPVLHALTRAITYKSRSAVVISINGAGLTRRFAQKACKASVVVFDDLEAVRALSRPARLALYSSHGITSSPAVAADLASATKTNGILLQPQPMMMRLLQSGGPRTVRLIWRRPLPSLWYEPGEAEEDEEIIRCLSHYGLCISVDAKRARKLELNDSIGRMYKTQRNWNTLSAACESYGRAELALITTPTGQRGEVTSEMMVALGSGALPITSYDMAGALFRLLGESCSVPMYKTLDELQQIVDHFGKQEVERQRLIQRCQEAVLRLETYSTHIGRLMKQVSLSPSKRGLVEQAVAVN